MKKNSKISLVYLSNFYINPRLLKKKATKIQCKKFILFLFFFFFFKKKFFLKKNIIFFILPSFTSSFSILRAPYRFKLSRDQLTLKHYFFKFTFILNKNFNNIFFDNISLLLNFLNFLKKFSNRLESNICFQKKITINFNFNMPNNFLITKYK